MSADAAPLENQVFARVGKLLHKYLKKHVAKISRVFKEFDTSGDGRVDKKEFTVGIRSIVGKNTMTKEEISDVWKFVDKDGGGTVTLDGGAPPWAPGTNLWGRVWLCPMFVPDSQTRSVS